MIEIPEPFHWRPVCNEVPRSHFPVLAYSAIDWGYTIVEWDQQINKWRSEAMTDQTFSRDYFSVWMYIPLLPKALPMPFTESAT